MHIFSSLKVIGTTPKMICHVFESEEVSQEGADRESDQTRTSRLTHNLFSPLAFLFPSTGSVHRAVHRPGVPSRLHGIPQGQRNRGPLIRQRNGLPGKLKKKDVPFLRKVPSPSKYRLFGRRCSTRKKSSVMSWQCSPRRSCRRR